MKTIIISAAILLFVATTVPAQGYHILKSYPILSSGRWDYIALSPINDNIYVSHMTQVNILNRNTGDSVGIIPNTDGVHGIAFVPALGKGFTSNGKSNTVTVFDINTNKPQDKIKTGDNPDAIMYDGFSGKLYVCDGKSKDLCVIDPATNRVIKTIALGGKPETAVSDGSGKLFVNIEDKNEIVVINTKTLAIINRWKIGHGDEPTGLAIDIKTKRLFAGCGNNILVVINTENGKVVKEIPTGKGCDGVGFDNTTKLIFSSNGEGTLTVVKENSADDYSIAENVATQKGAKTLVIDEKTHKVYLPTAKLEPTKKTGQKHPDMIPGTFHVLVVGL